MKVIFSILFTFVVILAFHHTGFSALKFYPAFINLVIFSIFFSSLFMKETIIQKLARKMEGHELSPEAKSYTYKATIAWCIFQLFNFSVSFATIFMTSAIWTIYNGCISYLLTGIMFAVEYIIRIRFKRKHNV